MVLKLSPRIASEDMLLIVNTDFLRFGTATGSNKSEATSKSDDLKRKARGERCVSV